MSLFVIYGPVPAHIMFMDSTHTHTFAVCEYVCNASADIHSCDSLKAAFPFTKENVTMFPENV